MAIAVADNFSYQGTKPLDARFQFNTVASMKAAVESTLYNGCFAYVTATKKYYSYDSSNSVDTTLGRWREYESGGASTLSDLTDTSISSPLNGQVLTYNGSAWGNVAIPSDTTKQPKTLETPITIGGTSRTTVETALNALNAQSKPIKFTGAGTSSGTISRSDIVAAGCSVTYYWVWPSGSSYGTNDPGFPLPFNWTYAQTDITYLVTITKDSDDTYIEYVAYAYFTYSSKTYSKIYTRVAKKSGSTYTFPDWIESNEQSVPILGSINRSDIYDTTEKVIGKWTDGRPLYQKVVTTTLPTATTDGEIVLNYVSMGVSISTFVSCEGFLNLSGAHIYFNKTYSRSAVTPTTSPTVANHIHGIVGVELVGRSNVASGNPNSIQVGNSKVSYSGATVYIIARYTKTTDAANSYNYADENDYSTSEKVIGTWIDGKKIYQRVFTGTTGTCTTDGEAVTVNIDMGVSVSTFLPSCKAMINVNGANCYDGKIFNATTKPLSTSSTEHTHYVMFFNVTYRDNSAPDTGNRNKISVTISRINYSNLPYTIIAQYTKV